MTTTTPARATTDRYLRPGWFTQQVFNRGIRRLVRLGFGPRQLRELSVVGRTSGEQRTVAVHVLEVGGGRYLIAPRGTTEWVRNLRAADGHGELRVGRRREAFHATELADADKPPVLREYLRRFKSEVKVFFTGIDQHATDEQVLGIAPGFPVFEIDAR